MSATRKTVLVTGASRGIGLEACRTLLAQLECNVVTLSRTQSQGLLELSDGYPQRLAVVKGDVSNDADQKARCSALPSGQR